MIAIGLAAFFPGPITGLAANALVTGIFATPVVAVAATITYRFAHDPIEKKAIKKMQADYTSGTLKMNHQTRHETALFLATSEKFSLQDLTKAFNARNVKEIKKQSAAMVREIKHHAESLWK